MEIDMIFDLLSSHNSPEKQAIGIAEAKKIQQLSVLFQPIGRKDVWENCAIVLSEKTNNDLKMYVLHMLEWLQDMNWPGSEIIYNRLLLLPKEDIESILSYCLRVAQATNDYSWFEVLYEIKHDNGI